MNGEKILLLSFTATSLGLAVKAFLSGMPEAGYGCCLAASGYALALMYQTRHRLRELEVLKLREELAETQLWLAARQLQLTAIRFEQLGEAARRFRNSTLGIRPEAPLPKIDE